MTVASLADLRLLTPEQQREALQQLAMRYTDQELARQWDVSTSTVRNLRQKFGLRKRARRRSDRQDIQGQQHPGVHVAREHAQLVFELSGENTPQQLEQRVGNVLKALAVLGKPIRYTLRFECGPEQAKGHMQVLQAG